MLSRRGRWILASALLISVAGAWWVAAFVRSGLPQREGQALLRELTGEVTVHFDEWAVPHVQAQSVADLARAIGYLHANERLLQLELGRRMASGRLSEVVGDIALPSDRYYVGLGMRRYAQAHLASAGAETRQVLDAYAEGVNAWLASRDGDLPPELRVLGVRPAPWRPIDSIYLQLQLAHDLSFFQGIPELGRLELLGSLGPERFADLTGLGPEHQHPALATLELGGETPAGPSLPRLAALPWFPPIESPGSNNWALGRTRTAESRAIVANDPHLPLSLPSVWYQVSAHAPGYSAQGFTLPGFPVVVLGQGPYVAWAFTNVMLDDHDVFLEDVSIDSTRVRRGDAWLEVESTEASIARSGAEPEVLTVRFTDVGVLRMADPELGVPAYSLAWTGAVGGDMLASAFARARARTVDDLSGKFEGWIAPAQNVVAADRYGDLFFTAAGRVPDRAETTGRLPAPGWDPGTHWAGLLPQIGNRTRVRPESDWIITANAALEGSVGPDRQPLPSADFDTSHRMRRIAELLAERSDWSLADMPSVQMDVRSSYASEVLDLVAGTSFDGRAAEGWSILSTWDRTMQGTGGALLFTLFERHLHATILDEVAAVDVGRIDMKKRLLRILRGVASEEWFDVVATPTTESREETLQVTLAAAFDEAVRQWGDDPNGWEYGAIHQLHLQNPLGTLPVVGRLLNRGPLPWPGSDTTVAAFGTGRGDDWQQIAFGPSMRWISDPADPDRSLVILPGGQAGHPRDAHYADQLDAYGRGEVRSVIWSADRAEQEAASTLRLVPEGR
ncbi:MAG: hypothetical protein GKS06_08365 [Acidobacteria bacterium]|nr:hypothetical protein [Acidobacteriota bacterium]